MREERRGKGRGYHWAVGTGVGVKKMSLDEFSALGDFRPLDFCDVIDS